MGFLLRSVQFPKIKGSSSSGGSFLLKKQKKKFMAKRDDSVSESENSESREKLDSEDGVESSGDDMDEQKQPGISDYEKQRLARMAENRARMEALGLSTMASTLMNSRRNPIRNCSKRKGKRKAAEDDEDYRPNNEDDKEEEGESDAEEQNESEEEKVLDSKASQNRKTKVKTKGSKTKKKPTAKMNLSSSDYVDGDEDIIKAIALSLQESEKTSGAVNNDTQDAAFGERKGNARLKKKKSFVSRVQMTEDEMILHFFQFDEAEKGGITLRDLRRVAAAHDFTWDDKELADMINCFDNNGDGKLDLEDFRKIVSRCNMLQSS